MSRCRTISHAASTVSLEKKKKKKKRGKKSIPCFPKLSLGLGLKRSHYSRKDYRDERVGHSAVPFPEKQVVVSLDYMCLAAFHLTRRRKNGGREGVARTEEHCRAARLGFTRNIDSICEEWPLFLSLSLSFSHSLCPVYTIVVSLVLYLSLLAGGGTVMASLPLPRGQITRR